MTIVKATLLIFADNTQLVAPGSTDKFDISFDLNGKNFSCNYQEVH